MKNNDSRKGNNKTVVNSSINLLCCIASDKISLEWNTMRRHIHMTTGKKRLNKYKVNLMDDFRTEQSRLKGHTKSDHKMNIKMF